MSVAPLLISENVIPIDASELVSRLFKRSFRRCMRNKILRSANNKYRYILPFDFSVFWPEFIDLVYFLAVSYSGRAKKCTIKIGYLFRLLKTLSLLCLGFFFCNCLCLLLFTIKLLFLFLLFYRQSYLYI